MRHKKNFIVILAAALVLIGSACTLNLRTIIGTGPLVQTYINMRAVQGIDLKGSFDVEIKYSEDFLIEVIAQKNITDLILIERKNNTAVLRYKRGFNVIPTEKPKIIFHMPEIFYLNIDGSGNIISKDYFISDRIFRMTINGSGNIEINTKNPVLFLTINGSGNISTETEAININSVINGSGDINLSGKSNHHSIKISGSGDVRAMQLETKETEIEVFGSGSAFVFVNSKLFVNIKGSGDVFYKGNPKISSKITGTGKIRRY